MRTQRQGQRINECGVNETNDWLDQEEGKILCKSTARRRARAPIRARMSLLESPGLRATSSSVQSIKLAAQEYVLSLASLLNYYAASASTPTNSIYIFDKSNLQNVRTLPGQESAIMSLRTISNYAGLSRPLLAWSGKDGFLKVWDERTSNFNTKST